MITPTLRAIFLMLIGVPVMLVIAVIAPQLWAFSLAWIALILILILADSVFAARLTAFRTEVTPPTVLYMGANDPADITISFDNGPLPARMQARLEGNEFLADMATKSFRGFTRERTRPFQIDLTPLRRGTAMLTLLWVRWNGPLGLVTKRRRVPLDMPVRVIPNIRYVQDEAIRLYSRDADFGIKTQVERGEGSEFDALREFTTGMDRRAIDWKHSARHRILLAKEFRTERNHNIVFAFDTGRLMSEPLGGVPKIDRAINAALLLSYVSLRSGDRTALFGFDERPGTSSGILQGTRAFPKMQELAATLNYSTEDANYTLALSQLAGTLQRRSLIILFTDFVDTISAELMLENVARLTKKHLVLFATFEDETLGDLTEAMPDTPEAVARAVIADNLLQERDLVFKKLARMGALVIETRPERFGGELVSRYLQIKQREML